jgi:hypothetical protein
MATDSEKINYLAGEISAFRAFALALINSHPDVQHLADEFLRLSEAAIGISGGTPVSEQYVEAQRKTIDELNAHMHEVLGTGF